MSVATLPAPAAGQLIPTPPDFPVVWADPSDARLTWSLDPVHFPEPLAPLTSAVAAAFMGGGNAGFALAGLPESRFERINTYLYVGSAPTTGAPEAVTGHPPGAALDPLIERFEA